MTENLEAITETTQPQAVFTNLEGINRLALMGRTAIYQAMKDNGFPQPYRVGKRQVRWKISEVLEWLDNQPRGVRSTPMDAIREGN